MPLPLTPEQADWLSAHEDAGVRGIKVPSTRRVSKTGKVRYDGPGGWAAPPGSGPEGETCKTCVNAYKAGGGNRDYWKCRLVKRTGGPGSDIRLKWPACSKWEGNDTRPDTE